MLKLAKNNPNLSTVTKALILEMETKIDIICKSQAVIEFDLQGVVLYANKRFLDTFGYTAGEVVGRHHSLFVDPEEVRRADYETFWAALRAGQYRSGEYRRIDKDGREVWLQASYNAIRDLNGVPFKIVKYAADVTETVLRKREEARLRADHEAAEAAAAAKSAFLANMSHELRTPLTSILGFSRLISGSNALSEIDREHVALIRSAGDTLMTVINDILDFSKLEAGAMQLSPQPFSVSTLIEGVGRLLSQQAEDKGLSLSWRCDDEAILMGDASRLRQVLLNLVGNAIKFTSVGGVTIRARTQRAAEEGMAALQIEVEDTGIGLTREESARLFNRFVQVDGSITRRFGGTGLGLAISRQIMDLMGGEIEVRSEQGKGTAFQLAAVFPVTELERTLENEGGAVSLSRPLRVLVADDHCANRKLVGAVLEPLGIVVDAVENGEAAVDAASGATVYDLILMDMHMPVMDGPTAARAIRKLTTCNSNAPIVALTANILPEQIALCLAAGMQTHLAKPIDFEDLVALVVEIGNAGHLGPAAAAAEGARGGFDPALRPNDICF